MSSSLLIDIIYGVNTIDLYFSQGIDINYQDGLYLETAARYNHKDIIRSLVKKGIDVEARDCIAIEVAICNGHIWIAKFLITHLIEHVKPIKAKIVIAASQHNRLDLLKILIKYIHHDLYLDSSLYKATLNGNITIVKYLMKKFPSVNVVSLIPIAAKYGHLRIVKHFIESSKNEITLNSALITAFDNACSHNRLNIVTYIMKNYPGCFSQEDLNNIYLSSCENNSTPSLLRELEKTKQINCHGKALEIVVEKNNCTLSRYLVKKCTTEQINKALLKCVDWRCFYILLKKGADIHYCEEQTLKNAILRSNTYSIHHLLDCGANLHINNEEPLRLALSAEVVNSSLIELLITKGADLELASAIILSQDPPNMYAISNLSLYYEKESFYGDLEKSITDLECGICLTEFKKNDNVFICKVCKHAVHKNCQNKWKGKCIYCRN